MSKRSPETVARLLSDRLVVELSDVREALDGASRATAFRYLKKVPYRSSYNYNGRYYTFHDPARYDRFGLWSHRGIHFSRDSSLQAAVTRLARESEAGFSQKEMQDLLRVRVQAFLLAGVRRGEIARESLEGLYVYLHTEPSIQEAQLERRRQHLAGVPEDEDDVSDEVVIQVLLVLVRRPGSKAGEVVQRLRGRLPPITRQQVDAVFARHDLGEKGGL